MDFGSYGSFCIFMEPLFRSVDSSSRLFLLRRYTCGQFVYIFRVFGRIGSNGQVAILSRRSGGADVLYEYLWCSACSIGSQDHLQCGICSLCSLCLCLPAFGRRARLPRCAPFGFLLGIGGCIQKKNAISCASGRESSPMPLTLSAVGWLSVRPRVLPAPRRRR